MCRLKGSGFRFSRFQVLDSGFRGLQCKVSGLGMHDCPRLSSADGEFVKDVCSECVFGLKPTKPAIPSPIC